MHLKIIRLLKEASGPLTQKEIAQAVGEINRAVLLGYLRALKDLGKIRSKLSGRAWVYYSS